MKIDDILASKGKKDKSKSTKKHIVQKSTFNIESPKKKSATKGDEKTDGPDINDPNFWCKCQSPFEEDKKQERGGDNKSQRIIQIHEGSFTVRQRST